VARIATDPYRPTKGAMPSEDLPLVIESSDKLPARNETPDDSICCESKGYGERQGRHTSKVQPKHARASIISLSKEVSWLHELPCRKGGRTIILYDYDGILVIDHPEGNQWNGKRGERGSVGTAATLETLAHIYRLPTCIYTALADSRAARDAVVIQDPTHISVIYQNYRTAAFAGT
jgi:hypothetical protein